MASSSLDMPDIEQGYADITIEGEDDGDLGVNFLVPDDQAGHDHLSIVGFFLTARPVDFEAMRHVMASLCFIMRLIWKGSLRGVRGHSIINSFFFGRLQRGEDPKKVVINSLDMWVQIHGLQTGFKSASVVERFGNFVGTFIKSDPKNFQQVWREYMRVHVPIDITVPLKRRKILQRSMDDPSFWAEFKYEYVPTFCFICGVIGHSEKFCSKLFEVPIENIVKPYGVWMRAQPWRRNNLIGSQWLRDGNESDMEFVGRSTSTSAAVGGLSSSRPISMEAGGGDREMSCAARKEDGCDSLIVLDTKRRRMVESQLGQNQVEGSNVGRMNVEGSIVGRINEEGVDVGQKPGPPIIMSIISWNCRGLGNPRVYQFLVDLVVQKKPNFLFLCETFSGKEKLERLRVKLGFDGLFSIYARGHSGGLAMLWRNDSEARLLGYSFNHIDMEISEDASSPWRLAGVYGDPNRSLRYKTWDLLRTLRLESNLPWCVIGDLNNVTSHLDKRSGHDNPQWLLDGFNDVLAECDLINLDLLGYLFTWERGRGTDAWIEVCLDRALVSSQWFQWFNLAKLTNLEITASNHCVLLLEPIISNFVVPFRQFLFENVWLREPMCLQLCLTVGSIVVCKREIRRWKKGRDATSIQHFRDAELKLCDSNSKFFHAKATDRKKHNTISRLQDDSGRWVSWDDRVPVVMLDYFKNLFTTSASEFSSVVDVTPSAITLDHNQQLLDRVTEEEVRRALFHMHPGKSPGPDGMTHGFFQKYWNVVKDDVVQQVRAFFDTAVLLDALNDTNIVLISKKKQPISMSDLWPISLCNVLYKIISKVVVNHLKVVLPHVISPTQSAFIPGCLILDNIMIAFEVMHYLKRKRKGKEGYMALKLDLSKAYERVEWGFLRAMVTKMGFATRFVDLVLATVGSVRYKIVHGGHVSASFVPGRGIRQGDPLSPYLFLICAEGFTSLIKKFEVEGLLKGCKIANGAPLISHMLFADDSYVYCRANE
ncbi:uncharacterized protein LOC133036885 [Cannabis sativa]|uniref:uncharacterized protein LOC133036885 n=1 Tax=Cannabis sativa TaxID=3483 RepID=UPI0029CA4E16|nr:uncharacterized protein LOC133036885 [Cannabis sativa]